MSCRKSKSEPLRGKDAYNRMTLQITWAHAHRNNHTIKFDRLRLDYEDSHNEFQGNNKSVSEGLKI
jgi:hypothetical protein